MTVKSVLFFERLSALPWPVHEICRVKSVTESCSQVEGHAYFPQDSLIEFCKRNNIVFEAYSPIGSPERWGGNATGPVLLEEPILATVGKKYGKSPAQVLIRWLLQRGVVVLPKSVNKERLKQNIDVWDFSLNDEDLQAITSLGKNGKRLFDYAT